LLPHCCRHRRSHRAAATALPPSHCALPPLPLTLPPPQRRRQAAANIPLLCCRHRLAAPKLPPMSLSRCRHRRSCHAAATALPPLRCAPPPRCCRRHAAADLALSRCRHRRRCTLVGCCVVIRHPILSLHAVMSCDHQRSLVAAALPIAICEV
jgi:hypothetical protein